MAIRVIRAVKAVVITPICATPACKVLKRPSFSGTIILLPGLIDG